MTKKRRNKEVVGQQQGNNMDNKHKPSEADVQRYLRIFQSSDTPEDDDPLAKGWDHMNNSRGWK